MSETNLNITITAQDLASRSIVQLETSVAALSRALVQLETYARNGNDAVIASIQKELSLYRERIGLINQTIEAKHREAEAPPDTGKVLQEGYRDDAYARLRASQEAFTAATIEANQALERQAIVLRELHGQQFRGAIESQLGIRNVPLSARGSAQAFSPLNLTPAERALGMTAASVAVSSAAERPGVGVAAEAGKAAAVAAQAGVEEELALAAGVDAATAALMRQEIAAVAAGAAIKAAVAAGAGEREAMQIGVAAAQTSLRQQARPAATDITQARQEATYQNRDIDYAARGQRLNAEFENRDADLVYRRQRAVAEYTNQDMDRVYQQQRASALYENRDRDLAATQIRQQAEYENRDRDLAAIKARQEAEYLNRDGDLVYRRQRTEAEDENRSRDLAYDNMRRQAEYENTQRDAAARTFAQSGRGIVQAYSPEQAASRAIASAVTTGAAPEQAIQAGRTAAAVAVERQAAALKAVEIAETAAAAAGANESEIAVAGSRAATNSLREQEQAAIRLANVNRTLRTTSGIPTAAGIISQASPASAAARVAGATILAGGTESAAAVAGANAAAEALHMQERAALAATAAERAAGAAGASEGEIAAAGARAATLALREQAAAAVGARIAGHSGAGIDIPRTVVTLGDEFARGQRGAMMGTFGRVAKDAGLGVTALSTSVVGLVAVMGTLAIGREAENLGKWATELRASASAAGMTVQAYSGLQAALTSMGLEGEEADATLRHMSETLSQALADPASKAAAAFHNLGISQEMIDKNGADTSGMLHLLADAFTQTADGANKSANMAELLGWGFERLIPLLQEGGAGVDAIAAKQKELGRTIDEDGAKKLEELGAKVREVGEAIHSGAIPAFVAWAPVIETVADGAKILIGVLEEALTLIGKVVSAAAGLPHPKEIGGLTGIVGAANTAAGYIPGTEFTQGAVSAYGQPLGTAGVTSGRGNIPAASATMIDTAAKALGISQTVADLGTKIAQGESGGKQYTASGSVLLGEKTQEGKQAVGLMQVEPDQPGGTTRTLEGTTYDLKDPIQNVKAGLIYLNEQFHTFGGDLTETALAYHSGPNNVQAGTIGPKARAYIAGMGDQTATATATLPLAASPEGGPTGRREVPPLTQPITAREALGDRMSEDSVKAGRAALAGGGDPKAIRIAETQAEIQDIQAVLQADTAAQAAGVSTNRLTANQRAEIDRDLWEKQKTLLNETASGSASADKQATQDFISQKKLEIAEAQGDSAKITAIYDDMLSQLGTKYKASAALIASIEKEKVNEITRARLQEVQTGVQLTTGEDRTTRILGQSQEIATGTSVLRGQHTIGGAAVPEGEPTAVLAGQSAEIGATGPSGCCVVDAGYVNGRAGL